MLREVYPVVEEDVVLLRLTQLGHDVPFAVRSEYQRLGSCLLKVGIQIESFATVALKRADTEVENEILHQLADCSFGLNN